MKLKIRNKKNILYILATVVAMAVLSFGTMVYAERKVVLIDGGVTPVPVNTSTTKNTYAKKWQYWAQGASKYPGLRSEGCRVVAYSKMLAEAGYTRFSNPDGFYKWGIKNGYFVSYENPCELSIAGTAPAAYVKYRHGTMKCEGEVMLSGIKTKDAKRIMKYIKKGYYVILYGPSHTVYIGREASLEEGTAVMMDSWNTMSAHNMMCYTYASCTSYTFTSFKYFSIDGPDFDAKLSNTTFRYDGNEHKPEVTVEDKSGNVLDEKYYTITYPENCTSVGTHYINIKFKGVYDGVINAPYTITNENQSISAVSRSILLNQEASVGATVVNGEGELSYVSENTSVVEVTEDGRLIPKSVGKTSVIITASATESSEQVSKRITIKVRPVPTDITKVESVGDGSVKVSWTTQKGITGYQIQYADNPQFTEGKAVKFRKCERAGLAGLAQGKKYYIRLRTYKKTAGVTYYSDWSKVSETVVR